jgi:hypothetical protein
MKEEVLLMCLWIGHTCLTHGHLLWGDLAPLSTISHLLLACPCYDEDHRTFHLQGMLSDILGDDCHSMSNIMTFLNGIGFAKFI